MKFSVPKSYFRNAGKIYVWGTHDNIDDRELTNIGGGEVIYPETPRPIISYTVTFKVDGKTALETEVPAGTPVSRPDIKAPEGSTLDGWYTDQACTTPYDFTKDLNREITLYARTEKNPVKKRILTLAVTTKGKTAQVLRWSSVNDADGYTVYAAPCNGTWKRMKSVKGTTASGRTCVMKKRTPGKSYKYLVKAYRKENGKKIYFMKSLVAHSIANNQSKTYTNAKAIRIGASDMTMNAGSKAKIVKKTVRWNAKKRLLKTASHAPYYRYLVDAPEIASVKNGVITAKKSGTCKIYVTAQNGLFKVINVTVK